MMTERSGCFLRRLTAWLPLLTIAAMPAAAGTVTGKFVLPNTNISLANATLTFTLNQAATVPGNFAIVPESVSCATSLDGSVVGIGNPTELPSAQALTGSGTLPAGTYFIEISLSGSSGETLVSPEAVLVLTAPGAIVVHPPAQPAAATNWKVYLGTSSGGEMLQGTGNFGANFTQGSPLAIGTVPVANNSTICSLVFNDATVPAPTYYHVTLTDAQQNLVAGYPQNWYLSGNNVNVNEVVPLTTNPAVLFPSPVLVNPATAQPQSVHSALDLNQYPVENTSNLGPGMASGVWNGTLSAPNAVIGGWTPNVNVQLRRISLFAQTAGSGGTQGLTINVSDGATTCTFNNGLAGAAVSSSSLALGACSFNAGVALTVSVTGDDHSTRPGNLSWNIEMTGR